jgi:hypothetical protein
VNFPVDDSQTTTTARPAVRRSRHLRSRQVILGYLILAATTVAGFVAVGIALRTVSDRARDNERNVCVAAWDRYDGRVGLRSEMFAIRDRFIHDPVVYADFTTLTNGNVPPIDRPTCVRPKGMGPERPMP